MSCIYKGNKRKGGQGLYVCLRLWRVTVGVSNCEVFLRRVLHLERDFENKLDWHCK